MQNKVILLTEKHPLISKKGATIPACRQRITLRPFEPTEVQDSVTAQVLIKFAGASGLTVEIYDGRKHNKIVTAHAKELVVDAELEDLDLSQPGMLAAVSKQRKVEEAKANPLSREEIETMPGEDLLAHCKKSGVVPRQSQSVIGVGGDKALRKKALIYYGHVEE